MFNVIFDRPTRIGSQRDLRETFSTDRIYLTEGGSLTLEGEIGLAPGVILAGACRLSGPIRIDSCAVLTNVDLGPDAHVRAYSVISDFVGGRGNILGPFCFIRDGCRVGDACILGAHVEAARSTFANGVKISHRAFVGDASVGSGSIIGAGVVFCNFDGSGRQTVQIGSNVTVGSGSLLVAPLTIGDGAVIGAGSTITKDVDRHAKIIQHR